LIWRLYGVATNKWLPAERSLNLKKEKFYAKWAPLMMLVVFCCNYTWFLSLKHTLVSVNSIIYNCISVEVFIGSIPILNEGVSLLKIFAVLISIVGVIVIVLFDSNADSGQISSTWYGYVLLLVSLSFYCAQEVGYKVLVNKAGELMLSAEERVLLMGSTRRVDPDRHRSKSEDEFVPTLGIHHDEDDYLEEALIAEKENEESNIGKFMYSSMFLGIVAICNACFVIWLVVIWNYAGWEKFEWPNRDQTQLLLLNCLLGLVLILSIFSATAFTSPLVVSVGSLLVMPISMFFDWLFHDTIPYAAEWAGIVLITSGFVCIFIAKEYNSRYIVKPSHPTTLQKFLYTILHEKHFFTKRKVSSTTEWYEDDKRRLAF